MGGHKTGGLEQNWGPMPPRPGLKTTTAYTSIWLHGVAWFFSTGWMFNKTKSSRLWTFQCSSSPSPVS